MRNKKETTALIPEKGIGAWLDSQRAPHESIEDFAKRLGTTRQTISDVIHGRRQPGPTLIPLLEPLGYVAPEKSHRIKVVT